MRGCSGRTTGRAGCADGGERREQRAEAFRRRVLRAVQGGDEVGAGREPEALEHARAFERDRREGAHRVEHHVADLARARAEAFVREVLHRLRRRREQQVGQLVGDQAIRLLGHAPVEAAKAGLDVGEGHVQLRRRERRGERRVGVAVGQHEVRAALDHRRLERFQHARGLAAVRTGADAEVEVRLRDAELREEDV